MTATSTPRVATMRAVVNNSYGDASVLRLVTVPRPSVGPGEVLVRVHAASLNPADKFLMLGEPGIIRLMFGLARPRQRIRGQDFAGVVEELGQGVTHLAVGDEVYGELPGTLADYACGDAKQVARMPRSITFEQAAAVPMAALAALHGLQAGKVRDGSTVLINGAAGGIGTFAVPMAKALGATVTAVCSTRNVEAVKALGADRVIDYTKESLLKSGETYDLIFDNVGNHKIRTLRRLLNERGTLLPNTGEKGADGGVARRLIKARWHHTFSPHRVPMFASSPNTADLDTIARMIDDGTLTVLIDTMFDLTHTADAMRRLATRHARGKVVVTVRS